MTEFSIWVSNFLRRNKKS